MPILERSLAAWQTEAFKSTLKAELESLDPAELPLEKGVSQGGFVDGDNMQITVYGVSEDIATIKAKIGVFFTEIVINCGCGDDPMPINAYCEMVVTIDKSNAETLFEIVPD